MSIEIREMDNFLEEFPQPQFKSKVTAPKNPKLIRESKKTIKLSPSQYLKKMSMSTKEKLASTHEMYIPKIIELLDMGETSLQKNTTLPVDEPMFQPFPSEIFFQKYDKFNTYEVPLLLRNNDKVPRLIKVSQVDNPYFKIISPPDSHHKVGPGLSITFIIQFTPEENKDYIHEIIVSTEREKYVIPIKCIGARAILDFPDEINFSLGAVKFQNTKVLLIRNIGNKDAKFSLSVEKPFSVSPDHGILPVGDNMQVTIEFHPLKCGDYEKELIICYDSNETIYTKLFGAAQDVNVRLDKNSIRVEDTFITMTNQRTVTIHNRSDIIVHYEWKKYATIEEEEQQKLKTVSLLHREEENAKNKISEQSADYVALLSRNFKNKVKHAESNSYLFEDEVFFIQPIEGDLWPNSSLDVNIIFKPDFAQTYNRVAFCEITGRETRLPLRLCGFGSGPKVQLSIETLDVGNIFIGSTHVYEVVMSNKGFIDAIYSISVPNTTFGKCFMFEPNESLISPNGFQAIRITFKSNKLGPFKESFEFTIDGNPEKCPLIISGNIIAPTFNFDISKLKFGLVSFGFKYSQSCYLYNTSLVPMKYNLRVLSDSEATRSFDGNFTNYDTSNFKEFSLVPKSGIIAPQSEVKLLIEFIPHFIKKYETSLVVDIEDVGDELFLLPISARSTVPTISLLTNNLDMGRCFINYNYNNTIKLSNDTSLAARFFIMPSHSDSPIKFKTLQSEGIIDAHSTKEININVEALKLGYISADLFIKINGSVEQPLKCSFSCLSQGPVVHNYENDIDWGLTPLLQDVYKDIILSNESPIAASYTTHTMEKNSAWRLEPPEGIIQPGSDFLLKAICHLIDKKKYSDTIIIKIENSFSKEIKVKAHATGTSIVSEPYIGNLIDFGTYFSGGSVKKTFYLTNKSSRSHNLSFHPEGRNLTSINKREMAKEKDLPPLIFKIIPHRIDLLPGETKEIIIEGFSEKAQLIEEFFTCQAIIGKSSGKDRIMKFKIKCEFIEPLVSFSKKEIKFRCERNGIELPKSQTENIVISNISSLSLNSRISTITPFTIFNEDTNELVSEIFVNIKTGESKYLTVNFDPAFKKDFHNEIINGLLTINYNEHQHVDFISLNAEIFYPNLNLETNFIDFECILNNTEVNRFVNMKNIGPLPVNYRWNFVIDEFTVVERLVNNELIQKDTECQDDEGLGDTFLNKEITKIEVIKESNNNKHKIEKADNNELMPETVVSNSASDILILLNQHKETSKPKVNKKLEELFLQDNSNELPGYEEIFDISPIYGHLNPGESQKLNISFFGHKDISAKVKAICQVENGPEYEIILKGEASTLSYEINTHLIDLGHISYDQITEATFVVKNTGKVRLNFNEIAYEESKESELNKPLIIPTEGIIDPNHEQLITLKYLPGVPQKFIKKILFQVGNFPPDEILVQGEASFADVILDLPRLETSEYKILVEKIKNIYVNLEKPNNEIDSSELRLFASSPDFKIEAEIDRLAIQSFIKQQESNDHDEINDQKRTLFDKYESSNLNLDFLEIQKNTYSYIPKTAQSKSSHTTKQSSKRKTAPQLPDYILDFGHVILGTVKTHVIKAVNMGEISASFEIERQNFSKTGFLIDVERVKNLPNQESIEFLVTFDPRGANLPLGIIEHIIPINVINGPIIQLRLKANVTMPDLQISNDVIEFGDVKCGECKIITVQIHNHKEVRCDWSATYLPNKDDKFTPLHLKRKKKINGELNKPHIYEIMPPSGTMLPGQKLNIQIKFMPTEEKIYEERVTIRMAQSSQRLMVLCKGKGMEPRIEFNKTLLEFEPILPHSLGDEQEIKIINPCTFPIEIYNLEFDKNYLEEEKILRSIRGYDEYNTILLPPRNINEKLPTELHDYFEEQLKKIDEVEKNKPDENSEEPTGHDQIEQNQKLDSPLSSARVSQPNPVNANVEFDKNKDKMEDKKTNGQTNINELEKNPVYESIARYLGIDLSIEGRAARNRRGVAIIVNGAPLTGKTKASNVLAKHYDCALLSIDAIIIEAISNGKTPAAIKARQLCAEVAAKHADEQKIIESIQNGTNTIAGSIGISNSAGATGLSAEALAQHSLIQGSVAMSKKTSVAGDSHTKSKKKADISDVTPAQPSSPPPLLAPLPQKLNVSGLSQDDGYMSTILPEDVIVEILNERFQLPDCHKGIIIDSLDTVFCQNQLHAATAVLKSFNNRRYIYCFTLKSDFQKYKEQLNKIQEEKLKYMKEKEEQERIELEEMDDESYENMPDEKKKEIDNKLLTVKKLRLKREAEEKAAEIERREREQAELAKLEEERKKKKKTTIGAPGSSIDKKSSINQPSNTQNKPQVPQTSKDKQSSLQIPNQSNELRPHTRSENPDEADKSKRKRLDSSSKIGLFSGEEEQSKEKLFDPEEEKRKEAERLIHQKYKTFEAYFKDVCQLFDSWDRTQGTIYRQPSPSDKSDFEDHPSVKKPLKKQEKSKSKDKSQEKTEEKSKENETKDKQVDDITENDNNQNPNSFDEKKLEEKKEDGIGIVHIIFDNLNKNKIDDIFKHNKLPSLAEVLDGMGLGPRGPPIPPPAIFSVVPYPVQRKAPPCIEFGHYLFVSNIENDPNLISDEKTKEPQVQPENQVEDEKQPEPSKLDKAKKGGRVGSRAESKNENIGPRKASGDKKKEAKGRRESNTQSPVNDSTKQTVQQETIDGGNSIDSSAIEKPSQKLQRFRWCIPAQGEITIRIRFSSEETGQYDQTLNFEIVGTRRRYQLFCRGICSFPTISREPRVVFSNRKKFRVKNEIITKKYILNEEVFDFGPLLVGNNRERCKEGKFPEYQETITISNASPMEAEISFCFLEENVEKSEACFFLETTDMILKPNENKLFKVFATPKETKHYEDILICCIKENPEPVIFKFSCYGQRPELQLDKKEFSFKQVLLHRKDSRDIKMFNPTMIPVQWRLEGVDLLGDEFVCNQTNGVLEPNGSFNLVMHFRALKPLLITNKDKKALKLLVSDVNSFLGFMENHTIHVTAEAYDVALEINLPKGNDGGLEFGTIRVNSENKQICNLKNKGKYNIKYNFLIEPNGTDSEEIRKCLTISPSNGELQSIHDRNAQHHQVQVIINTKKELTVKDLPVLKCQITEPQTNEGLVIANIPIKISFKAVFSKFSIVPQSEINFGVMNINSKRQEKIIIENKGEFDFKFTISKFFRESVKLPKSNNLKDEKNKQREGSSQTKTTTKRNDSVRDGGVAQGRFQVGIYTITPAYGLILSGGHQAVTIDCSPETNGKFEEELLIDITDRDTTKLPNGVIYKLTAEATIPNISVTPDIFEEHTIIPNISVLDHKTMGIGIYCEHENRFIFNNVIVGRTAKARFKLYNNNKIPIDLGISLRNINKSIKGSHETVFDIEPQRIQIQPFCYSFTTVSFTPQAIMNYTSIFEATLESTTNYVKNKSINFDIIGEGNLPRFNVLKPALRNNKGQYLMVFKRNVINNVGYQNLVLCNDGTLPSKINFFLNDPDNVFKIRANNDLNKKFDTNEVVFKENGELISSIVLQSGQQISFIVSFTPKNIQNYEAMLQLTVTDNLFEDNIIQFIGEGYLEDVTIDNLHTSNINEIDEEIVADEEITAIKGNSINFGDTYINESKQLLFTMTNRNKNTCYRFEWPENNYLTFSPRIGHLHANCLKDISVTFKAFEPRSLKKELVQCTLNKITFDLPANEVKDWDDRMTIIKWVNEFIQNQISANDNNRPTSATTSSMVTTQTAKFQNVKKKIIEIEPEPHFSKIDDNIQYLELFANVNCDYSRYKCSGHVIRFKDTLMYQNRVYEITILNRGKIQFDYNWKIIMEDNRRPFTPLIEPDTPTPEPSPSPRGRSKGKGDNSLSPTRKTIKDTKDASKKDLKDSKVTNKKSTNIPINMDEKFIKSNKKVKEKESKDADDTFSFKKELIINQEINDSMKVADDLNQPRLESQAQMRAESSLSYQAPTVMTESGYVPFSIEPEFGKLEPGKSQVFKVKFSPLNVNDYQARLLCTIPNLEDGKIGPIVAVKGRSMLPYCHFDLDESDYITSGRRNPELPGPNGAVSGLGLDPLTKIIEFKSIGLNSKCINQFNIINPTNVDYEFEWVREDQNEINKEEIFSCLNESGILKSGRRKEIGFEFFPKEIGIHESFWVFKIAKFGLQVPFLLVGEVCEPKIVFDRSHILFKPLLVGMSIQESVNIINQENKKYEFKFDPNSCYTEGRSAVIIVEPSNGILQPFSHVPISLTLKPNEPKQLAFNLKCLLSNSSKFLNLNVKGEGFIMQSNLYCEDNNGNKIEFTEININEIHFGEVEKNEISYRNLYLLNTGKFTIDFECFLSSDNEDSLSCFSIESTRGTIDPGEKQLCILKYVAKKEKPTISNLIIKVTHGPVYHIHIDGIAVKPDIQFSFTEYNFGSCFIYKAGMPINQAKLKILNSGTKEINVDCLLNASNTKSCFLIDFKQTILMPKESTIMNISFIPRECLNYEEKIMFELNGLTRREISLKGHGTEMKVELYDKKQKILDIGTLDIGKSNKKLLKIVNKSLAKIEFNLLYEPKNEILSQEKQILQIKPFQHIRLNPNQTLDLELTFKPTVRIQKFYEEIRLEYNGICTPLFAITGACHGHNIWVDSNAIPFGAVVQKCSVTRRFLMHNEGDIGASFKWESEKLKPEFSIQPISGYISPGMEINFDVTFKPQDLAQDIRKENVQCYLEGCRPICVTFSGSCVQVSPQKEMQHFETFVRQKEIKQITLTNKTNTLWEIKPIVEGEFFSGIESFLIEPQTTKSYDIIYSPLTMTLDGKKHIGTCFFPLPDGTGLLYNLSGIAGPPKIISRITKDIPCKLPTTEILLLENWLKKPQRFKVLFDIIKPEKPDPSTNVKGHDYIDIPANGKKEYKVTFFAHKEGLTQVKVTFKNEQTGEYMFYELYYKAVKGGSIETIDLITPVRNPISYSLKLENPLPNVVSFTATCTNNTEISIPPNLQITAKGQGEFNFEYLPLKVGDMSAKLELISSDLGICTYDLNLKALPSQNEKPLQFKTTLGMSQTVTARFTNFCKQKTDYTCKIDNPDFKTDKNITAAPSLIPIGIEVSFDITYEPSSLGESKGTLVLTSPVGGDYIFPLVGSCNIPKPQGPFIIKANGNTSISFKNVFSSQMQFSFAIDNPLFYVTKSSDTIKAHQTYKIIVGFDGNDSVNKADVMGKLIVSPPKLTGLTTNVQWIYYLKGITS